MDTSRLVKIYETELLTGLFNEQGIFEAETSTAQRSVENYYAVFDLYSQLSNKGENKFCMLCDLTKSPPMSKPVRELLTAELPRYIKAMALISESPAGKAIGTIFITLTPQKIPVKLFPDRNEALKWLQQFV